MKNTLLIKMTDTTQFPYELLEEFGLTPSMIDDLPEHVIETLYSGGRSPLLPIIVKTDGEDIKIHAKFRLISTNEENGKFGVVFYPKMSQAPIDNFTEDEQKQLLAGHVIIADLLVGEKNASKTQCFVQIDKDTNHVFYVPTPVIGRNLRGVDEIIELTPEHFTALKSGDVVYVDTPEPMSIGINLFTETGVFVCSGDEANWHRVVGKSLPKYNFGIDGCWVNDNGELNYVQEDDYTPEMLEEQRRLVERYDYAIRNTDTNDLHEEHVEKHDANNQISR